MKKPFNDEPIETLVPKHLKKEGAVLDLHLKYIGDEGLKVLSQNEDLTNLRELNLERNEITSEGVQFLAESKIITGLERLYLERNNIGDDGVKIISKSTNFQKFKSSFKSLHAFFKSFKNY